MTIKPRWWVRHLLILTACAGACMSPVAAVTWAAQGAACADINQDGVSDIRDVVAAINAVFRGENTLNCPDQPTPATTLGEWFNGALASVGDPAIRQSLEGFSAPVIANALVHDSPRAADALLALGDAVIQFQAVGALDDYAAGSLIDAFSSSWPLVTGTESVTSDSLVRILRCLHECREQLEHCRRDSTDSVRVCVHRFAECVIACLRHAPLPEECIARCVDEYQACLNSDRPCDRPAWWCEVHLAWCLIHCLRHGHG